MKPLGLATGPTARSEDWRCKRAAQATRARPSDLARLGLIILPSFSKGLALPRASQYGEIALAGSRPRSTLRAAPVLFVHAHAQLL